MKTFTLAFKEQMGGTIRHARRLTASSAGSVQPTDLSPLARSGRTVAVLVTSAQIQDDSALWRIARYYQRDYVEATGTGLSPSCFG